MAACTYWLGALMSDFFPRLDWVGAPDERLVDRFHAAFGRLPSPDDLARYRRCRESLLFGLPARKRRSRAHVVAGR